MAERPVRTLTPDGNTIRKLRLEKLWLQWQLATKADVGLRTVQRAEASQSIEHALLHRLAEALGVPVAVVLP